MNKFSKAPTLYASMITDRCSTRMSVNLATLADVGTDSLIDMPKLASYLGTIQRQFFEVWYC